MNKFILTVLVCLSLSGCYNDVYDQLVLNAGSCTTDTECDKAFDESAVYARDHLCKSHKRDAETVTIPGFPKSYYDCSDFSVI